MLLLGPEEKGEVCPAGEQELWPMQITSRKPTDPRRWKQVLEGYRYYMLCTIPVTFSSYA